MSSSRARLADLIRPMLPEEWQRIEEYTGASIPTLDGPRVHLDYTEISHEGMPQGALYDGFDVAVISHYLDHRLAEDALDAVVPSFVRKLDAANDIAWGNARKRRLGGEQNDRYLSWIITVQLLNTDTQE